MKHAKIYGLAILATLSLSACSTLPPSHAADDARYDALTSVSLTPFRSENEYRKWLRKAESLENKRQKAMSEQFGDYLVLMQDGRLFSLSIGSGTPGGLRERSRVNLSAPQ